MERFEGKKILITGGLGFIGSNIARKAVALGGKVTVLDACLKPYGWNYANVKEIAKDIDVINGDIRDFDLMQKAIRAQDVVFDCAAQVSHTLSVQEPFLDLEINGKGPLTILESARQVNKDVKIVYASTRGVIGKLRYSPIDENHPTEPTDMNGIDKLTAEKYYRLYYRLYGIRTTSIRINNTFGPRGQMKSDDYGVVNWFIRRALKGEPIVIHGEGLQTRDYNYVDDVVDAMLLASQDEKADGEVFMLGSGKETRFIDMLKMIIKITGWAGEIEKIPRPREREAIEIGNFVVSIEKIKRLLGWSPRIGVEEGLCKTVDFYRERLEEYL